MGEERGCRGGLLEHRPPRSEVAAQHRDARSDGLHRGVERTDGLPVPHLGTRVVLAESAAGDRECIPVQQVAHGLGEVRRAACVLELLHEESSGGLQVGEHR